MKSRGEAMTIEERYVTKALETLVDLMKEDPSRNPQLRQDAASTMLRHAAGAITIVKPTENAGG